MRIMLGLMSQQQGLFILRHLKDRQQDSNFLQDFLCFHYFHLQCSFLPWSILEQPEIRHAISVSRI